MSNRRHLEKRRRKYNQTLKPFVGFVPHSGWFLRYTSNPLAANPIVVEPIRTQRRWNTYLPDAMWELLYGARYSVVQQGSGGGFVRTVGHPGIGYVDQVVG